jgi:histone H3/H4
MKRYLISSQQSHQKKMKMLNNNQRSNLTGGNSRQSMSAQSKQQQVLTPEPIRKTVVPRNKTGRNNRNNPYLSKMAIVRLIRKSGWDQVSEESRNTIRTLLDTLIRCALHTTNIPGPPHTNDFVIRPWNLEEIIKRLTNGPVSENVVQRIHPIVEGHLVSILKQARAAHKNKKRLQSPFITNIPLPAWCHKQSKQQQSAQNTPKQKTSNVLNTKQQSIQKSANNKANTLVIIPVSQQHQRIPPPSPGNEWPYFKRTTKLLVNRELLHKYIQTLREDHERLKKKYGGPYEKPMTGITVCAFKGGISGEGVYYPNADVWHELPNFEFSHSQLSEAFGIPLTKQGRLQKHKIIVKDFYEYIETVLPERNATDLSKMAKELEKRFVVYTKTIQSMLWEEAKENLRYTNVSNAAPLPDQIKEMETLIRSMIEKVPASGIERYKLLESLQYNTLQNESQDILVSCIPDFLYYDRFTHVEDKLYDDICRRFFKKVEESSKARFDDENDHFLKEISRVMSLRAVAIRFWVFLQMLHTKTAYMKTTILASFTKFLDDMLYKANPTE